MRLSMLPFSIAAHVVAFAAFIIVPLAGDIEAPTPWPLSSAREFITAAAVPPPRGDTIVRTSARNPDAAPIAAPDRVGDPDDATAALAGSDPLGDVVRGAEAGVPEGVTFGTSVPPPLPVVPPPSPAPPAPHRSTRTPPPPA